MPFSLTRMPNLGLEDAPVAALESIRRRRSLGLSASGWDGADSDREAKRRKRTAVAELCIRRCVKIRALSCSHLSALPSPGRCYF